MPNTLLLQIAHRLGLTNSASAMRNAQHQLASELEDANEKSAIKNMSLVIHRADGMYVPGQASHYLTVGLSALRAIQAALTATGKTDIKKILDLPCGYGRVLRVLKVRYPEAEIFAAELNRQALRFCTEEFSVRSFESRVEFDEVNVAESFDLIWCGSLLTHVDENSSRNLLRLFCQHLSPGGLCVFTTHGEKTLENLESGNFRYNLSKAGQQRVLQAYHNHGFGYSDYRFRSGYGISLSTREKILEMADTAGDWQEVYYQQRGWDNHQDVFGFQKPG